MCVIKSPLPPEPPAGCIFSALSAITQARCTLFLCAAAAAATLPLAHTAQFLDAYSLSIFPSARPLPRSPRSKCLRLGMLYEAKLHRGPAAAAPIKKRMHLLKYEMHMCRRAESERHQVSERGEEVEDLRRSRFLHNIPIPTNLGL